MAWDNFRYYADISSNNVGLSGAESFRALEYAAAGHTTVAIKVTEGDTYVNPYWEQWAIEAHEARLSLILYHFARPGDPVAQFGHFAHEAKKVIRPKYDAVALDLEDTAIPNPQGFATAFQHAVGWVGWEYALYSYESYLQEFGPGLVEHPRAQVWVARLGSVPATGWWRTWARQYSWSNVVRGLDKPPTDMNRMAWKPAIRRRVRRP